FPLSGTGFIAFWFSSEFIIHQSYVQVKLVSFNHCSGSANNSYCEFLKSVQGCVINRNEFYREKGCTDRKKESNFSIDCFRFGSEMCSVETGSIQQFKFNYSIIYCLK